MAGENVSSPAIQTATPLLSSPSPPTTGGAVNLAAQAQNFVANPSHSQIPALKPGPISSSARPFVQNLTQQQAQQVSSPAMLVQSPPQSAATSSLPRSSSTGRISPNPAAGLRPGQFSLSQQQQQQQQAQMLAARASQGQASQQRPAQSSQTPNLQGGQLTSQGLMAASSPMRPIYPPYTQMMRPGIGGQPAIPMQYMMQGRTKTGQVSSQFPAATGVGPMSAMGGVGMPMTRPSGPVGQQSQQTQRMQAMQNRQPQPLQQPQQAQSQSSLQMQQKMVGQMPKVPSTNSLQSGLPASQSPGGSSNLQTQTGQQAWGLKPTNPMSSPQGTYPVSAQQAALLKQGQLLYAHQMQGQQPHQASMNQPNQLGRAPSSTTQRPVTPTGIQPSTPGTATPTSAGGALTSSLDSGNRILGKRTIQDLAAQVDPSRRLDPEVEDLLLDIADDFIESVTTFACKLAKHRKSNILEAKDVLLHLNRSWDISIPGYGGEEYHAYKKTTWNETHKQRLALVKKSIAASQQSADSVAANNKASGSSTQSITAVAAPAQAPTTV